MTPMPNKTKTRTRTRTITVTGDTPVSGFSRAKRRLGTAMRRERRRSLGLAESDNSGSDLAFRQIIPVEFPDWRLHDLRRTATTGMASLNFPPHVVDEILNHTSGIISGVAAVYNRFEYLEDRRAALQAWGQHIQNIVMPQPSNIISIVRR
jgi:hypothetical protein